MTKKILLDNINRIHTTPMGVDRIKKNLSLDEVAKDENMILLLFERVGEVMVTCEFLIFPALNPYLKLLPDGVVF